VNAAASKATAPIDPVGASDATGESDVRTGAAATVNVGVGAARSPSVHCSNRNHPNLLTTPIAQRSRPWTGSRIRLAGREIGCNPARDAERGMKDLSLYCRLVRGHVAANPPLATHELAAFRAAVCWSGFFSVALGRGQLGRPRGGCLPGDLQQELSRSRGLGGP